MTEQMVLTEQLDLLEQTVLMDQPVLSVQMGLMGLPAQPEHLELLVQQGRME
jgi:hypothetical protein